MVGPSQQRTTPADGARPSKSVASSHQGRAGSARNRKGRRRRKGETGARENRQNRKQHLAHRLPLSPLQPQQQPQQPQQLQRQCDYNDAHDVRRNVDFMDGVNESDDLTLGLVLVGSVSVWQGFHDSEQPYMLPLSLVNGLRRCRICCSWTLLLCQWV